MQLQQARVKVKNWFSGELALRLKIAKNDNCIQTQIRFFFCTQTFLLKTVSANDAIVKQVRAAKLEQKFEERLQENSNFKNVDDDDNTTKQ